MTGVRRKKYILRTTLVFSRLTPLNRTNGVEMYQNQFSEMLRMYPPLPFLDRICTNDEGYSLEPYDNYVIPKGLPILIPIFSIQRDPKVIL